MDISSLNFIRNKKFKNLIFQTKSKMNVTRAGLLTSLCLWIMLCMGLLFTVYYSSYVVDVNFIVRNENTSYIAAVVDYKMFFLGEEHYEGNRLMNMYQFTKIIGKAAEYMVDIIVFPECGLFLCGNMSRQVLLKTAVSVPSITEVRIPCDHYVEFDEVISQLSCASKKNNMYVVVNVVEKFCPENCTDSNILLYNTEVVFDRQGKIVARYRKYNLYLERWINGINQTNEVELVTFTTDFNERFGLMVCFDILFKNPGVTLVNQEHVTSMIISSAATSLFPFLATSSIAAGWSYANNVNLLTADLPSNMSSSASNIYYGRNEQLSSYMVEFMGSKIIIGVVPKNGAQCISANIIGTDLKEYSPSEQIKSGFLIDDALHATMSKSLFNVSSRVFEKMDLQNNEFHYESDHFRCIMTVIWKHDEKKKPNYKFIGYSGAHSFTAASVNNYVEMCGLVLCSVNETEFCNYSSEVQDDFEMTIISANIVASSQFNSTVTIPSSLDSQLLPLKASEFSFNSFITQMDGKSEKVVEMNLRKPSFKLVNFGIYTLPQKSNSI